MSVLLLPKGLNEQVIKKITLGPLWTKSMFSRLQRCGAATIFVCHDGFGRGNERDAEHQIYFLKLLFGSGSDVRSISLYDGRDDDEKNITRMSAANVFYLAGGHEPEMTALFRACPNQCNELRRLITGKKVGFIGISTCYIPVVSLGRPPGKYWAYSGRITF